jgi:hypothetical protein
MDQDAPQHPIGIHDQIVEGPPGGGRAGDRLDRLGQVEDQNEAGVGAGLLAKALLLGPHALVAVEVEADRHRTLLAEAPDGLAEQLVIKRPAVGGDIAFADADQADRLRPRRGPGPQPGGQVVEPQVHRLGHQALAHPQQQQGRNGVGHQRLGPEPQGVVAGAARLRGRSGGSCHHAGFVPNRRTPPPSRSTAVPSIAWPPR